MIEINWPVFILGAALLAVPAWIVYRPDKKISKVFGIVSGSAQSGKVKFDNKNNKQRWIKIRQSIDKISPSSWDSSVRQADVMLQELLDKLEPALEGENVRIKILSEKNSSWLNVKRVLNIRDQVLADGLNQVSFSKVENFFDEIEKIFDKYDFI